MHPTFEPKVFTELRNAQSIVLAYDGLNALPPTYCYLKPHYLDKDRTYFEQLAKNMNIPTVGTAEAAWSRIIPFLRPIEPLIRDPEISDIMINGERGVFFEKHGRLERLPDVTIPEKSLQVAARNIARSLLVGEVRGSEAFGPPAGDEYRSSRDALHDPRKFWRGNPRSFCHLRHDGRDRTPAPHGPRQHRRRA